MPRTDAATAVEQAPVDATAPDAAPGAAGAVRLCDPPGPTTEGAPADTGTATEAGARTAAEADTGTAGEADAEDTLDLHLPDDFVARFVDGAGRPPADDLLDGIGDRGPVATPVGVLQLVPVHLDRDLPLVARWMNDPAVAEFWQLAGEQRLTEVHLGGQLDGDGRSVPCLGLLDGTPMSYWEIYRADLDPLARHYPARPHDTGVHLLIGSDADRGRGLGSALLRAVADLILDTRPACARVVAEPDLRNAPSVTAFLAAGFRYAAEVELPGKRSALMIRDRSLRHLM